MSKKSKDIAGAALIGLCLLTLAGMFYGAYLADKANGVSVAQSLAMWGF